MRTSQPVNPGLPDRQDVTPELFADLTFVNLSVARQIFLECHGRPVSHLPLTFLAQRLASSSQPDLGWRPLRGQADQIGALLERLAWASPPERSYDVLNRLIELYRQGPELTPFPLLNVSVSLGLSVRTVNLDVQFETRCLELKGLKRLRRPRAEVPTWPEDRRAPAPARVAGTAGTGEAGTGHASRDEANTDAQGTFSPDLPGRTPPPRAGGHLARYSDLVTSREWAKLNGYSTAQGSRLLKRHLLAGTRSLSRGGHPQEQITARNTLYFVPRHAAVLNRPVTPRPITDLISYPAFIQREGLKADDGRYLAGRLHRCRLGDQDYVLRHQTVTDAMRRDLQRFRKQTKPAEPPSEAFIVDQQALNGLKISVTLQLKKERNTTTIRKLETQLRYIDMTRQRAKGTSTGEIARLNGCTRQSVQQATQDIADQLDVRRAERGNPSDVPWGLTPIRPGVHRERLIESAARLLQQAKQANTGQDEPCVPLATVARLERLNLHLRLCRDVQTETDVRHVTTNAPGQPRQYARNTLRRIFTNLRKIITQVEQTISTHEIDALVWKSVSRTAWRNPHATLARARRRTLEGQHGTGVHPALPYNAVQDGPKPTPSRSVPDRHLAVPGLNDKAMLPGRASARAVTKDA